MSQIRTVTLTIENPSENLVKMAVEIMAKLHEGSLVGDHVSYYYEANSTVSRLHGSSWVTLTQGELREIQKNAKQRVIASFVHADLCPGGYGVTIEGNALKIYCDPHLQNAEYSAHKQMPLEEFQRQLNQAYKAAVYQVSMSRQGLRSTVQQQGKNVVVVGQM